MAESVSASEKLSVFISYSRDDLAFADQLDEALRACGFATIIDRHGISGGEDWRHRLGNLIRDADTIVFVLSPSSAQSEICAWEVSEAVRLGKRIIPVVCVSLEGTSAPQELAKLNFIFFYEEQKVSGSGWGSGLARLVVALNTNLDWLREHTRLLRRATEWDNGGRSANRLLIGPDIAAAKHWSVTRPKGAPMPTLLHLDYIRASAEEDAARNDATRKQLKEIAVAQEQRAQALFKAEEALNRERKAQSARTNARRASYTLLLCIIAGLVSFINQEPIMAHWYRLTQVWPYVLSTKMEVELSSGEQFKECSDCPDMIRIPAGEFVMGSPKGEGDENEPIPHLVKIASPFAVSKFEVTFGQWDACVADKGCTNQPLAPFGRGAHPVTNVSWNDAKQYVNWLSSLTSKPYRLLTESEWEYVARAGSASAYSWGSDIGVGNANCNGCGSKWDNQKTAPVGSFEANDFGIFDMHGNVWEHVKDCYRLPELGHMPIYVDEDATCEVRVIKGGAWTANPESIRSARRDKLPPNTGFDMHGFRVARTLKISPR